MSCRRFFVGVSVLLFAFVVGCSNSPDSVDLTAPGEDLSQTLLVGEPCGEPLSVILIAGQHFDAGEVVVYNDADDLFIEITTTGGWVLTETHVAVATSLEELPQTGSGNPKVGHFDLAADHDPPVTYFAYSMNYDYEPGTELFLAVHAKVELTDENGQTIQEETAWADGLDFPGNSWATYFNFSVVDCEGGGDAPIVVTYPLGGELCLGFPSDITWQSTDSAETVRIELLLNGAFCTLIDAAAPNVGTYEWPEVFGCDGLEEWYTIQITGNEGVGVSGDPFRVIPCGE